MHLYFPADRIAETFERVGYVVERGFALSAAIVGITIGTAAAIGSAALLRMTDASLARLAADATCPTCTPIGVEDGRTLLVAVVFVGLIWAATCWRKAREWFNPASNGHRQ